MHQATKSNRHRRHGWVGKGYQNAPFESYRRPSKRRAKGKERTEVRRIIEAEVTDLWAA